jgi:hypothetical protein
LDWAWGLIEEIFEKFSFACVPALGYKDFKNMVDLG